MVRVPGMSSGLSANNPTIVSAFYQELLHQGAVVALIALVVLGAWAFLRSAQLRQAALGSPGQVARHGTQVAHYGSGEALGRRVVRVGFGLLWLFDGLLQAQAAMPLGMPSRVIEPAAASSPAWAQHIVETLANCWSYHPVVVPAAAVWAQVGLGIWLLAASGGSWSRLGGVASTAWGLVVWVGGEAFGQVFAPGQSWLYGLPGSVLFYCAGGVLVALPEQLWATPRLGRLLLSLLGAYLAGMALLQAWPGRGFWQSGHGERSGPNQLALMVRQMAATPQPHVLSSWLRAFASFDAAHGFGVNLFLVVALAAIGALFLSGRRRLALAGVAAGLVLCAATWVLVQDLGFLGGLGTDPNSMVPNAILFVGGYLAMAKPSTLAGEPACPTGIKAEASTGWAGRWAANPAHAFRTVVAAGALAVTLVGGAPAAIAAANPNANPLLTEAVNGPNDAVNFPAPALSLIDQHVKAVSLSALRGKVVVLTFLDPVCTSDCPVIAQELKQADSLLGSDARHVVLVAVDANPRYTGTEFLNAFDAQEGMNSLANWLYLTGTLPELEHAWRALGATVGYLPGGAMVDHSEYAYVIGPDGNVRYDVGTDPGQATGAMRSSFAVNLASLVKGLLGRR